MQEMSIGEFARHSRRSTRALRLDDGLGVLVPERVDERRATAITKAASSNRRGSSRRSGSSVSARDPGAVGARSGPAGRGG